MVGGVLSYRRFPPTARLAELLSAHFTVINYDRRGRFDSKNALPYAVEREIEDLNALIQAVGGSAHVYGMSSGAALALRAAAGGLNITKLALYEPPFIAVDPNRHKLPPYHQAQLHALLEANRRGAAVDFFIHRITGAPLLMTWLLRLMPFWSQLKAVAHTVPYDMAILGNFELPENLSASIEMPTLVCAGGITQTSLRLAAEAAATAIPHAQYRVLPWQTHNVSPKALAPILIEFFKS